MQFGVMIFINGLPRNKSYKQGMLDYLYYKLYQAVLKGSLRNVPQIGASIFFAVLMGTNIIIINAFLAKINLIPLIFKTPKHGAYIVALLVFLCMLYFGQAKRLAILQKYSGEEKRERIKGNIIVSIYVGLSFLLIFVVASFRPGKL